jgi:hypothetical protein
MTFRIESPRDEYERKAWHVSALLAMPARTNYGPLPYVPLYDEVEE